MAQHNDALLEKIRSGKFTDNELLNLYENARRRGENVIAEAAKQELRASSPRAASRKFGAKEGEAKEKLEEIYAEIQQEFDLTRNAVKNGVKAGGEMLSGAAHIDIYMSYKNRKGAGVSLGLYQTDPRSEMIARVGKSQKREVTERTFEEFGLHQLADAVISYKERLGRLIAED